MKYFGGSLLFTVAALVLAGMLGFYYSGTLSGVLQTLFIVAVLGVLETSLSFDNSVVNARTLKGMSPRWRRRFLTWGIFIAVFGMRVVFPLLIVGIAGHLLPLDALMLAFHNPEEYERVLTSVHAEIAAFGGAFLLMVGLRYFFDVEKNVHWVKMLEEPLARSGRLYMVEAAIVMGVLLVSAHFLSVDERFIFLSAGIAGLVTYAALQWLSVFLEGEMAEGVVRTVERTGLASFVYLEVLDASFSFDGVIGAFALSNNILVIALGLGIGAVFVRSITIMLVEKGTLDAYIYLEHGAFWAILGLATCMFLGLFIPIPEVVTGLIGAVLIGAAFVSSLRARKPTLAQT